MTRISLSTLLISKRLLIARSDYARFSQSTSPLEQHSDLSVIAFIAVINLPTVIKSYLLPDPASQFPSLLRTDATLQALYFPAFH